MHTITGTGKPEQMNKTTALLLLAIIGLHACNTPDTSEEVKITPRTDVEITTVRHGTISDNLELFANTIYLKRNVVTAPLPAYITRVNIRLGDKVQKGDILYELESKERRALGNRLNKIDSSLSTFGVIIVRAHSAGVVSTLDKQQTGDYVLEGTQLCTISESNDLAFQVNVPFEYINYVKTGKPCRIVLPDNSIHPAYISMPLSNMNVTAQTQSVLAKSKAPLFLPENLIVKVLINKGDDSEKQVLPLSCIQSDEMMKTFWVMRLINDSTAVRVPVKTGNKNQDEVEILSPRFDTADKIVLNGSYGLGDTALVNIVKPDDSEK